MKQVNVQRTIKDKKRQSKTALANMRLKAKKIEKATGMLVRKSTVKWTVFSDTTKMGYIITLGALGIVCGCPAS